MLVAKAKRGDKGEGSIYQSKNGSWVAEIRTGGKRKVFYGKTESELQWRLHLWQVQQLTGLEQLMLGLHGRVGR